MDMNMIPAYMATENSDVSGFTCLTNQITGSQSHLTFQNVVTVFCNPDKMILKTIDRMRAFSVFLAHGLPPMSDYNTFSLLKLFA